MMWKRKTTPVEAVQLTWANWEEVCQFVGACVNQWNQPFAISEDQASSTVGEEGPSYLGLLLPGPDGKMLTFRHGDWVIKDSLPGSFYPCKPDIFRTLYEPLTPNNPGPPNQEKP